MSRRAEQKPTEPIDELLRENAQLRRELERERAERARVERERLERENTRLKDELEPRGARGRGQRPFSQGAPKWRPRRPGHLLRRCRTLQEDHPRACFPRRVARILQHALDVRDRRVAGTISAHGVDVARGHLFNQMLDLLDDPGLVLHMQRFARHLTVELPALFSFLVDPDLDATNWRAEQAIRPPVIT